MRIFDYPRSGYSSVSWSEHAESTVGQYDYLTRDRRHPLLLRPTQTRLASESSRGINTDSVAEIRGFGSRQNFESMVCNGRTQKGVGGPITLVVMVNCYEEIPEENPEVKAEIRGV